MNCAPTDPRTYYAFRPGHPEIWRWLARHLRGGDKILDVGCGPGVEANALTRGKSVRAYVGVDIAYDALAHARKTLGAQGNVSFVLASAEDLPFVSNSFGLVAFFLSLHQIGNPHIALHEAVRVMSPSGAIGVLLVEKSDWQKAVEYECFPRLKEIEETKSGRVNAPLVETWLSELGLITRRAKFHYLEQRVNQELLEACGNMYFSSLKRLDKTEFEKGIRCLEQRVASSVVETRNIFCTVLQGRKK